MLGTVIRLFIPASVHLWCTWPAVYTVQMINNWRKAGLIRGFVDYSENGEQIDTQIHTQTHTQIDTHTRVTIESVLDLNFGP